MYAHKCINLSNIIFLFLWRESDAFLMRNPKYLGQIHPSSTLIAVNGV